MQIKIARKSYYAFIILQKRGLVKKKMQKKFHVRPGAIRKGLNKIQPEFTELLGVSKRSIWKDENRRDPSYKSLIKPAQIGDASLDWVLTGEGRAPGEGGDRTDFFAVMSGVR